MGFAALDAPKGAKPWDTFPVGDRVATQYTQGRQDSGTRASAIRTRGRPAIARPL